MKRTLYFVCPTDHLEPIICDSFLGESYFMTSLGNSLTLGGGTMKSIATIIRKRNITDIVFVLSDQNKIIKDAIDGQEHRSIGSLKSHYDLITQRNLIAQKLWRSSDQNNLLVSSLMGQQINELKECFDNTGIQLSISGKVYVQATGVFENVISEIACGLYSLN